MVGQGVVVDGGISIHAPVKGATRSRTRIRLRLPDFNPRSREGSDPTAIGISTKDFDFNPRSREGSDPFISTSVRRR